ncbi:MAG TPA: phenylalanine--tRNA ligase subunit beta [Syntrophorhabdaceae bacterium]|nr:phenylalanine--tRNA ligase subunit beta [Syntrophorhabdaceae bacterium]
MKIPFEWLQEFVVIDIDPQELAKRLTLRGLEVESIEKLSAFFAGVVVGEIKNIEKHPNAENLSICTIDAGSEDLVIVCGAKNIARGDKVPLAKVGARLARDFVIEQKKLRGVDSYGMLCSEKELGLSDDHSGIFILPKEASVGSELAQEKWVSDSVLDINVPPNRGDCLSVLGIAREVASILNQKAKLPSFKFESNGKEQVKDRVALDIKDFDACPRYVLKIIEGTSIITSPYWMRSRLLKCGMRPISSIVDVTNYVMLELGQPLHAFDYERIQDRRIEVRRAEQAKVFRTLDGMERKLEAGDILICDGSGPVAVAGIMGGENSEITESTRNIALESAYFNPLYIRKTARRLGIRSEASLRFEKGIDIDNVLFAAERAVYLMREISGGAILKGERELYEKREPKTMLVTYSAINGLLGTHIREQEINRALRSIDLHIKAEDDAGLVVAVPHFRHDINEPADIVEEISRIHGFEHIPATSPLTALRSHQKTKKDTFLEMTRDYFRLAGFDEIINFAFFSAKDADSLLVSETDERRRFVPIVNPISRDYSVMRTCMTPGMLKTIAYNLNRGAKNLRLFEKGKVFFQGEGDRPREETVLCFAMTGKERDFFWREKYTDYDFFDIKGVMEGIIGSFGMPCAAARSGEPFLHPMRGADIYIDDIKVGWIGEIRDDVLKTFEIEQSIYCAELNFDIILHKGNVKVQYKPIPRYPQVTRDFSFYIDDAIPITSLVESIKKLSPLITSVGIFDMFRKETRSVAFRVVFQSFEDTLKDETVNGLQQGIIQELSKIDGISLRT